MNILVIGSGGSEHSLSWKIARTPLLDQLYVAPGNGGMGDIATCVDLNASNHDEIVSFCREKNIEFVVIGPEAPLVEGLSDRLIRENIKSFGPSAAAAILEGSKGFTKDLCAKYDIPTAAYGRFNDAGAAKEFVASKGAPIVIKADGLAAGKGVIMAETLGQANAAIDDLKDLFFGGHYQVGVNINFTKLVLDHRDTVAVFLGQNVVQQGSLARPQKAGEDCYGNGSLCMRQADTPSSDNCFSCSAFKTCSGRMG